MKCVYCGAEMQLRQEHCPRCGKKAVVDFDVLKDSVHQDAASRRTEQIEAYLKWSILALLIGGSVIYGINDLFDKPLIFDGSVMPALPTVGSVQVTLPNLEQPYKDPRNVPNVPLAKQTAFGYRKGKIRDKLRAANRGDIMPDKSKSNKNAIADGLNFLVNNQNSEGCWRVCVIPRELPQWNTSESDWGTVGVTGLALLAFFGEGEMPGDPELDTKMTPMGNAIFKGVRYLILAQDEKTGRLGPIGDGIKFMYNHGMGTMALCEAAGLTGDFNVRESAQKAVDFIVKTQATGGGWNYYAKVDGDSDTSVSAWQVQALVAAREAGLKVPPETLQKALEMYKKATSPDNYLKYSLDKTDPLDPTRISLFGVGLMMRNLLGDDPRTPALRRLAEKLAQNCPEARPNWGGDWKPLQPKNDDVARGRYDPYLVYFGTYGLFFMGGKDWEIWHEGSNRDRTIIEGFKKSIIMMQSTDGSWKTNDQPNSYSGGTVYSTALSILSLQVYYRYQ